MMLLQLSSHFSYLSRKNYLECEKNLQILLNYIILVFFFKLSFSTLDRVNLTYQSAERLKYESILYLRKIPDLVDYVNLFL